MSEPPDQPSGSRHYLPPPPADSPESVDVPRMEPPPASLEAMVRSRQGTPQTVERRTSWLWFVLLIVALVAIAYYLGLAH